MSNLHKTENLQYYFFISNLKSFRFQEWPDEKECNLNSGIIIINTRTVWQRVTFYSMLSLEKN